VAIILPSATCRTACPHISLGDVVPGGNEKIVGEACEHIKKDLLQSLVLIITILRL
jgi:hypothetical protein